MATSTVENYLKTMLQLDEGSGISVGAIAESLEVTPGTVSSMMRHLASEGLIDYIPRRSVNLLPKGRTQALKVVRRHRIIETYLVEVMKLDWSEVHEEAEVLEHVISDRLLGRMDEMLGFPSHDPHGDPIPDREGNVATQEALLPLSDAGPGKYRIVRVSDSDSGFLDWLRDHRLLPGSEFEIQEHDPVAGIIEIQLAGEFPPLRLGEKAAVRILVERTGGN